jgi:hypothetical protein
MNDFGTNLDMSAISGDDKHVLAHKFYTLPNELPLLEIHFSGQNSTYCLSNKKGFDFT